MASKPSRTATQVQILPSPIRDRRRRPRETASALLKTPKPQPEDALHRALAWRAELVSGRVRNRAAIARREGLSRARVAQIMALLGEEVTKGAQ